MLGFLPGASVETGRRLLLTTPVVAAEGPHLQEALLDTGGSVVRVLRPNQEDPKLPLRG